MIDATHCEKCGCKLNGEAAYIDHADEVWCHSCADNAAEAAYERHQASYHDGGDTSWLSLRDQQIEARRFK